MKIRLKIASIASMVFVAAFLFAADSASSNAASNVLDQEQGVNEVQKQGLADLLLKRESLFEELYNAKSANHKDEVARIEQEIKNNEKELQEVGMKANL